MNNYPGSDIDRQLAEKVMGWVQRGRGWFEKDKDAPDSIPAKLTGYTLVNATFGVKWRPSTDIRLTFEVVEKLHEMKYWFELSRTDIGDYIVRFRHTEKQTVFAEANTPAIAICLAALEAVKGHDDG